MDTWSRTNLLYFPPIFAVVSLAYISFELSRCYLLKRDGKAVLLPAEEEGCADSAIRYESLRESVKKLDGFAIFTFRFLRLLTVISLFSLEIYELRIGHVASAQVFQCPFFAYMTILAVVAMVASPRWRDVASLQLALLLFADLTAYFILDVWPYTMINPTPFDPPSEATTWVRFALLMLGGLVITLVMPRPFRPSSLGQEPCAWETASLLSRYSYSYLDGIVFYAYRVPDITVRDMPQMPHPARIAALGKRALAALDPVKVGKRHLIWGILRVWTRDYVLMTIFIALYSISGFAGPFGMRNLLASLETGTPAYGLHLWVWILMLVIGPVISGCFYNQFLFHNSRVIVENASVLTYLVFHHALRIRLKSDSLDSDEEKMKQKEQPNSTDDSSQTTATPAVEEAELIDSEELRGVTEATASASSSASSKPSPMEGHAQEKTSHLIGKINNLLTSDLTAVGNLYQVVTIPGALIQLVISMFFLYSLLGWSAFMGFAVMLVCLPVPVIVGKSMVNVQKGKMEATDKRVQSVTEALGVIRMIKLFGWESYILEQIGRQRDEELTKLRHFKLLNTLMNSINEILPLFSKLTSISIFTLASKGELTASRIFAALMIFSMMEEQLYMLVSTIPNLLQSKVSCDRYTRFLNSTELLSEGNVPFNDASEHSSSQTLLPDQPPQNIIGFKRCAFSWDAPNQKESATPSKFHARRQFNLRFDDEVAFKRGLINIIVGPTASGKTSVLMALLGEMYYKPQGIDSWYSLPRDEGIAYAPQESWVLNDTVRGNIVFGEAFKEERYKKVLSQCALEKDLLLWEAGDQTEVGEKGLTLSGGQKARVTLARALYSSASIILLDDILAALDVHTAKWIVEKALRGDLVQGRTILLVTHNISLTAPVAGHVVVLSRHGSVSAQGSVSEILKKDSHLRAQVEEIDESEADIDNNLDEADKDERKNSDDVQKAAGKLVVAEEKAMGRVEIAAILLYVASVGGPFIWIMIVGGQFLATTLWILQTWFMGYWSSQYEKYPTSEVPALKYLMIFAVVNFMSFLVGVLSLALWIFRTMRASKLIHSRLLQSIFKSSFRWLDITPVGRITTRCTQDMSTIDEQLAMFTNLFIILTLNLVCFFLSSVIIAGWYALISGALITILATSLGRIYLKCQMCTRREMSNAKAPVMSQVGTALSGLPSIRAYNAQRIFYNELERRIDLLATTSYCFYDINRWVSIRIDSLGAIFSGVVAGYLVYGGRVQAGYAGFTLSVVLAFSRQILFWVRIYNLAEIQANSLERMLEFLRIDHEPEPSESGKPPAYWPSSGELRVEKLCARYSDDSPTILRDISFSVRSGERVGVVGRTGAGKSSVALALLRAIKTDGKVYYDGLATDDINLDALRTNITLIPQQPELIHGTLRENLDPFGQHEDATLNDALNAAGFFSIKDLATNQQVDSEQENGADPEQSAKIGLDAMIESGGTNFSLGQRQIIALARAIVRRSKLLILDEATAAIDYDTDAAIQKTLRTEFSKDTTLITIAHRLHTIVDYDKIMVLEAGELVEFDSPENLLKKEGGYFRALVDESDDRELLLSLVTKQ